MAAKKVCFVIAPIGDEKSEERKRSDQVLKYIIEPVADKIFSYTVIRADKIAKPGMITSQVIQHLFDADLVIADLAYRNPNVFYELALRHAVRKPFVQIIEEGETIPFDVAGLRTIHLNHRDLGSAEKCKEELNAQMKAIESDPSAVESPITQAVDVQMLRTSGKRTEQYLAELMDMLSELKGQVSQLASRNLPLTAMGLGTFVPNVSASLYSTPANFFGEPAKTILLKDLASAFPEESESEASEGPLRMAPPSNVKPVKPPPKKES